MSSHLFEDNLCRRDKGGLDIPVNKPTCCQFILSFVLHPSQSLLSVPDSTEALAVTGEAWSSSSRSCGRPCREQWPGMWPEPRDQFQVPRFLFHGTHLAPASFVSFIYLFNKYLLGTYYVSGPVLSMGDAVTRRNVRPACSQASREDRRETML